MLGAETHVGLSNIYYTVLEEGIGNAPDADTFRTVVRCKTVPEIIVAAGMSRLPHFAILPVVRDGNRGKHLPDLLK